MKNANVFLCALVLLALASVINASVNPKVELVNYSLSEIPLQPGHTANLTLQLKSVEWDNCAERVSVQLIASYPLSIQGPDTRYIDELCLQDPDSKGAITFQIPVDALAQAGTNQITVVTTYEKRFSTFSDSNTLNVRVGGTPSLQASIASSSPADIYAGDSGVISIVLYNSGSDRAESVQATLTAPDGIEAKWGTQVQQLGTILAKASAQASFGIEAAKNMAPGNYTMHLTVKYASSDGTSNSYEFPLVLPIKPKADFTAAGAKAPLYIGETQDAQVVLRNTGSQEAKNLKVRISPLFPFSSDGTVKYIDSLKPGQEVNLSYSITTDSTAETGNAQVLTLLVSYEDPAGKKFSDSADFSFTTAKRTLTEQLLGLWYIWVIIIAILVITRLRRRTAKK